MVVPKVLKNGSCLLLICILLSGIHSVREGQVGIYYQLGSLTNEISNPGLHLKYPWPISIHANVDIRPQTDQISQVMCGTSDGLNLVFESIDVGNTLIAEHVLKTVRKYGEDYDKYLVKDKVRHQIQILCSGMNSHEVFNSKFDAIDDELQNFLTQVNKDLESGLLIDFVRLSKPILPEALRKNYERLAEEKTNLKVEAEKQERLKKEAETREILQKKSLALDLQKSQMSFQIDYERAQSQNLIEVDKISSEEKRNKIKADSQNMIELAKKTAEQECNRIDNLIKEANANTSKYTMLAEAEGLHNLYAIQGYKEFMMAKELSLAIGPQSKFFFGQTIPNFLPVSFFSNPNTNTNN